MIITVNGAGDWLDEYEVILAGHKDVDVCDMLVTLLLQHNHISQRVAIEHIEEARYKLFMSRLPAVSVMGDPRRFGLHEQMYGVPADEAEDEEEVVVEVEVEE